MYDTIVEKWYICLKQKAIGEFCTKCRESKLCICLARDEAWKLPLRNVFLADFFIKSIQLYKVCPKMLIRHATAKTPQTIVTTSYI